MHNHIYAIFALLSLSNDASACNLRLGRIAQKIFKIKRENHCSRLKKDVKEGTLLI